MLTWVQASFEAAHRLPQHPAIHGHSYLVRVYLAGEPDVETVQAALRQLLADHLDHAMLNDRMAVPTMENIARYVAERLPGAKRVIVERPTLGVGCEYAL